MRSIAANMLVCLAVLQASGARSAGGKFAAIVLPIMGFVTVGFEHSIANMVYMPLGLMYGASVDVGEVILRLLICVLGNFIGGSIIGGYFWVLNRDQVKAH
jgi:formate/nitrite transporter FocA (FNT family)